MTIKTKNSCSTQENTQQTNYSILPEETEEKELFFWELPQPDMNEQEAEIDLIRSLIAEGRAF